MDPQHLGETPAESGEHAGTDPTGQHLGLNRAPTSAAPSRKSTARLLWAIFSLFVVYGTSFPFRFDPGWGGFFNLADRINWRVLGGSAGNLLISDIVQNILLFIPFGFLGYFSILYKKSMANKIRIVLAGSALSLAVEFLQIFSPIRHPALSDVVFNTMGAALGLAAGVLLKKTVLGFKSHPLSRDVLDSESAFPSLVFLMLVVAGCWEPFDFSLDVGSVWGDIKHLIRDPIRFYRPKSDLVDIIRFLLTSLFVCRLAKEARIAHPVWAGGLLMAILAMGLEATQVIIQSRTPEFQDAINALLGIGAGMAAYSFPPFHRHPVLWTLAGSLAVFVSAAINELHPFVFSSHFSGFNVLPFLPQFERTTFASFSSFVETGMIYFPVGFLFGYFHPRLRPMAIATGAAGGMSLALELAQGFVPGRYPDITDVLGAALGAMVGSLALVKGWPAFREYMREDADTQV